MAISMIMDGGEYGEYNVIISEFSVKKKNLIRYKISNVTSYNIYYVN